MNHVTENGPRPHRLLYIAIQISVKALTKHWGRNSDSECHNYGADEIYEGRTESHEQLFLHENWEQQTKDSAVVDGTSCCVILECLVTSIACITWLVSLLTKWPTTICHFASVLSSNSMWKRKSLLQKFTRDFSVLMEVLEDGWNILKMGKRRQFKKQCVSVFGWLERSSTAGEFSNFQNAGRYVYKEVSIMWKNK